MSVGRGAHVCDGGSVAVAFLDEVRAEVVAARVHRCPPMQAGAFSTRKQQARRLDLRQVAEGMSTTEEEGGRLGIGNKRL